MQKDIHYRLTELGTALRALEIGITNFNDTRDEAHLLGVKATLRALVASGGRSLTPLLLDLSDRLQIPLEFYSFPPKPPTPRPNLVSSTTVSKDWAIKASAGMQKFILRDWLLCPAFFVDRTHKFVTRNDVLRQISESEGGAHFDLNVKEIIDSLSRSFGSIYNGKQFFLVNLSALVFWSGQRMLFIADCRDRNADTAQDERVREHDSFFNALIISM